MPIRGGKGLPITFWDGSILAKNGWGELSILIFFLTKIASRIVCFIDLENHDFETKQKMR